MHPAHLLLVAAATPSPHAYSTAASLVGGFTGTVIVSAVVFAALGAVVAVCRAIARGL